MSDFFEEQSERFSFYVGVIFPFAEEGSHNLLVINDDSKIKLPGGTSKEEYQDYNDFELALKRLLILNLDFNIEVADKIFDNEWQRNKFFEDQDDGDRVLWILRTLVMVSLKKLESKSLMVII